MLDVDGNVIGASDLVLRVRRLLQSREAEARPRSAGPGPGPAPGAAADLAAIERRARIVQQKQAALRPPDITTSYPGLASRGALAGKRAVRKLVWWYVEPRWQLQAEIDAEIAWLAAELVAAQRSAREAAAAQADELAALAAAVAELAEELARTRAELTTLRPEPALASQLEPDGGSR